MEMRISSHAARTWGRGLRREHCGLGDWADDAGLRYGSGLLRLLDGILGVAQFDGNGLIATLAISSGGRLGSGERGLRRALILC